jgi:hypothetical protein
VMLSGCERVSRKDSPVFDQIRRVTWRRLLATSETTLHSFSHGSAKRHSRSTLSITPQGLVLGVCALHITSLNRLRPFVAKLREAALAKINVDRPCVLQRGD